MSRGIESQHFTLVASIALEKIDFDIVLTMTSLVWHSCSFISSWTSVDEVPETLLHESCFQPEIPHSIILSSKEKNSFVNVSSNSNH